MAPHHSSIQLVSSSILINSPHMLASVSLTSPRLSQDSMFSSRCHRIESDRSEFITPRPYIIISTISPPHSCFPSGAPGLAYTLFPAVVVARILL